MTTLVFSDRHFFRERSYLVDTCKGIADQIRERRPTSVVFCGDLNHAHNYVETGTLHDMAAAISVVAAATYDVTRAPLMALSGNHDTALRSSGKNVIEAIASLNNRIHAITEPLHTAEAIFAPHPPHDKEGMDAYTALLHAAGTQTTLFGHLELSEVRYSPASSHATDHPVVVPDRVRCIVNGHYHHPEHLKIGGRDVLIVGSPCYHTYADMLVETPRGIMLLHSTDPLKVERVENPHGPIYHTIEPMQISAVMAHPHVGRMLVRVKIENRDDYEQWKAPVMRLREVAKSVRVIGKDAQVTAAVHKTENSTLAAVDPMSMLQSYIVRKSVDRHVAERGVTILQGCI